jgi:hypothetical protein
MSLVELHEPLMTVTEAGKAFKKCRRLFTR